MGEIGAFVKNIYMVRWLLSAGAVILTLFTVHACFKNDMTPDEAQRVLNAFYADKAPEEISNRHLVTAGRAIVPYLVVEIRNRDMPRRRYAIGALEKIKDKRSLPVLIQIVEDESEIGYFREDALRAIWHIDRALGIEYAHKLAGKNPDMDRTIELLRSGRI